MTGYDGWEPISHDPGVVWTGINQAYPITVHPPCGDLMFSDRVGLTSFADTVSAMFDFVRAGGWQCRIRTIRPLDQRRMLRDERKARTAHSSHPAAQRAPD